MKAISEYFPSYQYQYLHIIISLTKILYKKPADLEMMGVADDE